MEEKFDEWNEVKKRTAKENILYGFKERDIFYIKMGENLGFEQNGKGNLFIRPIVVLKKLNSQMFVGIPLSTQLKKGSFFFEFSFMKKSKERYELRNNIAILAQIRTFSVKRLLNKIGMMENNDFEKMKEKLEQLLF